MRKLFWLAALLTLSALACNAPLNTDDEGIILTAEPTIEPTSVESPATAPVTAAPAATPSTTEPTATSDSTAGGLTRTDGPTNDAQFRQFRDDLVDAIVARNYDAMQAKLSDTFVLGFYQSEGVEFDSAEEAIATIEESVVTPTAFVSYTLGADVTDAIEPDPMTMWDPAVNVVAAIPFEGFGEEGDSDALVIIAEQDGVYRWYATLLVPQGLAE